MCAVAHCRRTQSETEVAVFDDRGEFGHSLLADLVVLRALHEREHEAHGVRVRHARTDVPESIRERGLAGRRARRCTSDGLLDDERADVLVAQLRVEGRRGLALRSDGAPHRDHVAALVLHVAATHIGVELALRRFLSPRHHDRFVDGALQALAFVEEFVDARVLCRRRARLGREEALHVGRQTRVEQVEHVIRGVGEVGKRRDVVRERGLVQALIPLLVPLICGDAQDSVQSAVLALALPVSPRTLRCRCAS